MKSGSGSSGGAPLLVVKVIEVVWRRRGDEVFFFYCPEIFWSGRWLLSETGGDLPGGRGRVTKSTDVQRWFCGFPHARVEEVACS